MYGDHPPAFGSQHPWQDPLAPQDVFDPRPDADFAAAGALAPRPEEFPFTDQGRRDYYGAVRGAAQQQRMMEMQVQHRQQAEAAHAAGLAQAEAAAIWRRKISFLLLSP